MHDFKSFQTSNFNRARGKFEPGREAAKPSYSIVAAIGGSLIFLSSAIYGGADAWTEAALVAAIFLLGAWVAIRNEQFEPEKLPIVAPLCALAAYSFLQGLSALLAAGGYLKSSAALPTSFDPAASFWCALKFFAAGVFIKILLVDFRRRIAFLIWILVCIGNFYAVFGVARYALQAGFPGIFGWFFLPELRAGIGFGTFVNQNHFAFLMLMNLGLNAGLCVYGGLEKPARLALLIFSMLSWTAIVLTASRGGIVSSFVVVAVLILAPLAGFVRAGKRFFAEKDKKSSPQSFSVGRRMAAVAAIAAALVFGVVLIGQERVVQRFEDIPEQFETTTDTGGFRRLDVWRASRAMLAEHGIFGVGFGGFRYAVARYIDISGAVVPREAHNDYLETAASGGVFAVLCAVWFLYQLFRLLAKRFSEPASRLENAARIGAVGAFAGIVAHSFFDFGLQFAGNWLFCAALASVAVCRGGDAATRKNERGAFAESVSEFASRRKFYAALFYAAFLLALGFSSLYFGYSRLENALAKAHFNQTFARDRAAKIPFDADFYGTAAFVLENSGDLPAAAENLERAISYRPNDYVLFLRLGKIRQARGETGAAETAFRRALELAPRYGEPRFLYGKFLLADDRRKSEAFEQLRIAFNRDSRFFTDVVSIAWRESRENADRAIALLSPLGAGEKENLAAFLYEKNAFQPLAALVCRDEDLTERARDETVRELLEKRQFSFAFQVERRLCRTPFFGTDDVLADGDFEIGDLRAGAGFGWRVGDLPEAVEIELDRETFASGRASWRFVFGGDAGDPAQPLIRQIVVVEKNRQYRLSFAYRSEKITSGGVPLIEIIGKQSNADVELKEVKLKTDTGGEWTTASTLLETGNRTAALEIRLARQPCGETLCPIYGRLWVDNFVLSK